MPGNVIEAQAGEMFYNLVKRAKTELLKGQYSSGYIIHNDTRVAFDVDSKTDDICIIYDLKRQLEQMKTNRNSLLNR